MYIAQKIELKPNNEVKKIFHQNFSYSRYIYNKALAEWNRMYEARKEDKNLSKPTHRRVRDNIKKMKEEWESEQASQVLDTSVEDVGKAFNMFFKKLGKYPKFKSKKRQKDSFRFYRKNDYTIQVKENWLKLTKIPSVKMKESLICNGTIKEVTITKKGEKYFASFIIDTDEEFYHCKNNKFVGIDLGVKTLAIINGSDGKFKKYKSLNKKLIPLYNKIKFYSKILSRKVYKSNKYNRTRNKLDRIYLRIQNIQKDYIHKITTNLVANYQYITIEDLAVSNMMKNKNLSRSISQSLWRTFRTFLEYKSSMYGNKIIIADRWFPSTQLCSNCGHVFQKENKLKLKDRIYICPSCGKKIDRDFNAAINLKLYGMRNIGLANKGQ